LGTFISSFHSTTTTTTITIIIIIMQNLLLSHCQTIWSTLASLNPTTVLTTITIPTIVLAFLANACSAIIHDYRLFLSLGPGGTPSCVTGYLRIKFLGLFALRDPLTPVAVPAHFKQQTGRLSKLPRRAGERPTVRGIAPHRQTNQKASSDVFAHLSKEIRALSNRHPDRLVQKTSCLEKHGPGLFVVNAQHLTPHCNGEVCHAHPSDGSMHLTLHPADAAIVLRSGWGERHPLGSGGWLKKFVPAGFILVYAPRTEEEVEIALRIVRAAVWWVGGVDVGREHGDVEDASDVRGGASREVEMVPRKDWLAACPDPKQAMIMS
jgi:hypothetical protein